MKKVLSNNIATGVRQPYTKVTHEWYNAMIAEAIVALGKGLIGDHSEFTVLYGCINTDSPDADISAGAIFYDGEIYLCPAFVDATITNDIVGTITTAYDSGDPVLFSDGNSYNVHQVKTIVWSDAASGSGDIDFAELRYYSGNIKTTFEIGGWNMNITGGGTGTNFKQVTMPFGVNLAKILSINVSILDDTGTTTTPIDIVSSTCVIQGGVGGFTVTNEVDLYIRTGGLFDSSSYNDDSINRGYITIEYAV